MCPKSIVNVATGCAVCAVGQSECAGVAAASMDTATPPGFIFFSVMTELPVTYGYVSSIRKFVAEFFLTVFRFFH